MREGRCTHQRKRDADSDSVYDWMSSRSLALPEYLSRHTQAHWFTYQPLATLNFLNSSSTLLTNATYNSNWSRMRRWSGEQFYLVVCSVESSAELPQAGWEESTGSLRPTAEQILQIEWQKKRKILRPLWCCSEDGSHERLKPVSCVQICKQQSLLATVPLRRTH